MSDPDPDEMRATRDRLLGAADRFAAASADSLTKMQRAGSNWPGQSGIALQQMIERLTEQDREHLARMRDLAHHLPVDAPKNGTNPSGQTSPGEPSL